MTLGLTSVQNSPATDAIEIPNSEVYDTLDFNFEHTDYLTDDEENLNLEEGHPLFFHQPYLSEQLSKETVKTAITTIAASIKNHNETFSVKDDLSSVLPFQMIKLVAALDYKNLKTLANDYFEDTEDSLEG